MINQWKQTLSKKERKLDFSTLASSRLPVILKNHDLSSTIRITAYKASLSPSATTSCASFSSTIIGEIYLSRPASSTGIDSYLAEPSVHICKCAAHITRKRCYRKIEFTTIVVSDLVTGKTHGRSGSLHPMRRNFPGRSIMLIMCRRGEEKVPWP